jgi:hypothetical protein
MLNFNITGRHTRITSIQMVSFLSLAVIGRIAPRALQEQTPANDGGDEQTLVMTVEQQ